MNIRECGLGLIEIFITLDRGLEPVSYKPGYLKKRSLLPVL